ncbi:MAG: pyruvate kinase [Simkaniaceae bacterium]|nr:pyruvate kinase [Simkaniaceae bacterium]
MSNLHKTKIICTIGPSSATKESILALIDAGMNVARLNFSHGSYEQHAKTIALLKEARRERNVPLALMLDTKGPEVRVAQLEGGELSLTRGMQVALGKEIPITPENIVDQLKKGDSVLFDDGNIASQVVSVDENVIIEIQNDGILKSNKGINVPGVKLDIPNVTEKDRKDLIFGCEQEVDLVAASFVCSAEHIIEIKDLLCEHGGRMIKVIAKIESSLGVENFESIVHMSDGIMVARGDLGVELPLEEIPRLQKEFVSKTVSSGKPAIIATQMLESMLTNPRPTRAEVSDVANAIYDGASAVMLSGETAVGKYPILAVQIMCNIIKASEKDFDYAEYFHMNSRNDYYDVGSSVAVAAVKTSYGSKAGAIITCTSSGSTPKLISRFKPKIPILTVTPSRRVYHQLAIHWGVFPILFEKVSHIQEAVDAASCYAMQEEILQYGDLIIVTAGTPFGVSGTTNLMVVENIGDVLVRGLPSDGGRLYGEIALVFGAGEKEYHHIKGKIVVSSICDETYLPVLKDAAGLILQNHPDDEASEVHARSIADELKIPLLLRADGAMNALKEGQKVTFDPGRGLVFDGEVTTEKEMTAKVCYRHFRRLGSGEENSQQ